MVLLHVVPLASDAASRAIFFNLRRGLFFTLKARGRGKRQNHAYQHPLESPMHMLGPFVNVDLHCIEWDRRISFEA